MYANQMTQNLKNLKINIAITVINLALRFSKNIFREYTKSHIYNVLFKNPLD